MDNEMRIVAKEWVAGFQQRFRPIPQNCMEMLNYLKQSPAPSISEVVLKHLLNDCLQLIKSARYEEAIQIAHCVGKAFDDLIVIHKNKNLPTYMFVSGKVVALRHHITSCYHIDNKQVTPHLEQLIRQFIQHVSSYDKGHSFYELLYKEIPYAQLENLHQVLPLPKEIS